jgi:hypothetical protein
MTADPRWFAQPVPSLGAITSEGIKNPLGRPAFDRLTVLVREAAQNSWDARPEDQQGGVTFSVDLRGIAVDGEWRTFLATAPDNHHLPLRSVLEQPTVDVLFVSDRGTRGLGGPTRGGRDPGPRKDYLSFVLNVGVPRDRQGGGGTFGYGKAILYNCSRAQSILVHTRAAAGEGQPPESRFIGVGLGSTHVRGGREYTGRFWWGLVEGEDHVEPVRGVAADALAASLGFPTFGKDEFGTTIAIVGSDMDDRSRPDQAVHIARAIAWHLWPKLVTGEMDFSVTVDGDPVRIPGPEDHPVLAQFASAYLELSTGEAITRSGRELGRLQIQTSFGPKSPIDEVGSEAGLTGAIRHVCLMRNANLVVEYLAGDPLPDEHLWYAGVFRADASADVDAAFAASEPPTHDTWEPAQLEHEQKLMVKHALRKIREGLRAHATPTQPDAGPSADEGSLGALSAQLGGLIAPTVGGGASVGDAAGPTPDTKRAIKMVGEPRWESVDGQDVLVQAFDYAGNRRCTVEASVRVLLWGGSGESDRPSGGTSPRALHWRRPDGSVVESDRLALERSDEGRWDVVVLPVADTVTGIQVREAKRSNR